MPRAAQVAAEQRSLDVVYARLDELRDRTRRALTAVRAGGATGTHQARSERDSFAVLYENRLAQLDAAEDRLCFGRLDLVDGSRHHIGRIGLSDDDQRQLLLDWRAPAALPFYQATAVDPRGAVLRRHLTTVGRTVTHLEDDVLDQAGLLRTGSIAVSGEGTLLAALTAGRTGRMGDIVATIQAEQDRIIRGDLAGVLVVQGGPGTGKTAVALHRAAYLLYTHRERLERSGVLLVGPSPVFLRYIDQVLPSLGETGVVTTTIGDLLPDVRTTRHDDPATAALKGDLRVADVLAAAVARRQRVPERPLELVVRGVALRLLPGTVERARASARSSGRPHNRGRERFLLQLLDELARQLARGLRRDFDSDTRHELLADLRDDREVRRELNLLWLPLTPGDVLARLYTDPDELAAAAPGWRRSELARLHRADGTAWTVQDVPLLDELAELVGDEDVAALQREHARAAQRRADLEQARRVLQLGSVVPGMIGAEALAERWAESGPVLSVAERAAGDRTWTYGHVIVDEAQDLSPMAWRSLMRRCPRRSMTLVGDLAQAGSDTAVRSWPELLEPYAPGAWRLEELTVTYRTPGQIMRLAADVLRASGSRQEAPASVREGDREPVAHRVDRVSASTLAPVVREELALVDGGRIAVVVPRDGLRAEPDVARLAGELAVALPGTRVGWGTDALEETVAVLSVLEVKGLEFDAVILCEPADVVGRGVGGWGDLYVALTRSTQRLRVVHSHPLPDGMQRLAPAGPAGSVPA